MWLNTTSAELLPPATSTSPDSSGAAARKCRSTISFHSRIEFRRNIRNRDKRSTKHFLQAGHFSNAAHFPNAPLRSPRPMKSKRKFPAESAPPPARMLPARKYLPEQPPLSARYNLPHQVMRWDLPLPSIRLSRCPRTKIGFPIAVQSCPTIG